MHATAKQVGKRIKCPDCGTVYVVPPLSAPKPKPSVLASDEDSLKFEEWQPPPEAVSVVPPRKPMVYEDERDELLARQAERHAQGDMSGPQYDLDGRPIMPQVSARDADRAVLVVARHSDALGRRCRSVLFCVSALLATGLGTMFSGAGVVGRGRWGDQRRAARRRPPA